MFLGRVCGRQNQGRDAAFPAGRDSGIELTAPTLDELAGQGERLSLEGAGRPLGAVYAGVLNRDREPSALDGGRRGHDDGVARRVGDRAAEELVEDEVDAAGGDERSRQGLVEAAGRW